jgi:curved DNA-binding protein CbpA
MTIVSGRDHYDVLGVGRDASRRDIRRAYRALALRYHPDLYSGRDAASRFREISDAYQVLQDPAQRARYDARLPRRRGAQRATGVATSAAVRRSRDVPRFLDEEPSFAAAAVRTTRRVGPSTLASGTLSDLSDAVLREALRFGAVPRVRSATSSGGRSAYGGRSLGTEVWSWRR